MRPFFLIVLFAVMCPVATWAIPNNANIPTYNYNYFPQIDRVDPNVFIQVAPNSPDATQTLTLYGRNLTPAQDPRFYGGDQTVRVIFSGTGNQGWVAMTGITPGSEGDEQTITVPFSTQQWLSNSGPIFIVVKIRDISSSPFTVNVLPRPTTSPTLYEVSPNVFTVMSELQFTNPAQYYRIRLQGADLDSQSSMSVMVGGYESPIENFNIRTGTFEAMIPTALWNLPGTYQVAIFGSMGASNVLNLSIISNQPAAEPEQEEQPQQPVEPPQNPFGQ